MLKSNSKFLDFKATIFWLVAILLMTGWFSLSFDFVQAISNKINYQGRLEDKNGNAVNSSQTIRFAIYNQSSGGSALWSETKTITVTRGYFSTVLGDTSTLNLDFSGDDYYLGIKVGNDSEMTPRKYIGAAPYSVNADKVDGAHAGTGANNVLKLNSSAEIDIAGKIKTTGNLEAGSSTLSSLTVSNASSLNSLTVTGTTNLTGTFQLSGSNVTASASELNVLDGVTASTAELNVLDDGLNFSELSGTVTDVQVPDTITASNYLLLAGGTMVGALAMGSNNITGINQLALNAISTGTTTTGYIYYDSEDNAFYGRTNAGWVNFAGDTGDITSVTAGNGLTGGGTSGDVTLNVAAANGTITVNADSIQVGTIGSVNITDGAIAAADLASDSVEAAEIATGAVTATEILDDTILNADINSNAAIAATKIAGGSVSNTEFAYLDGVTSALQTQLDVRLPLAGGTMAGNITVGTDNSYNLGAAAAVWANGYFTSLLAGTGDALTITANTTSTWSTSAGTLTVSGADDLQLTSAGDDILMNPADDLALTLAAGGQLAINAFTIDSTVAGGVLEIDFDSIGDNATGGIRIDAQILDDADADVVYGQYISITHTSDDADGVYGLYLDQANTAGDVAATTALLALDNSETTNASDVVTAGILFLQEGAVGYSNAIDMSAVTTTNGINLGANRITGTEYSIISSGGDITLDPSGNNILPGSDNTDILGAATNVWNSGYFTNLLAGTGDALTITANTTSTWSTSDGGLTVRGDDSLTLSSLSGGIAMLPNAGQDLTVTLTGNSLFYIDANANDDITAFYLDVELAAGTLANSGFYLYYKPNGNGGNITDEAMRILLEGSNIADADDFEGLAINVALGSNAPDSLIELTNAQDAGTIAQAIDIWAASGGNITDGILFNGGGGLGNITDAIDASYANISNAINIGANNIEGTNFDVDGNGNITVAAAQGLDTNGAGDLEIGVTNATSVTIGTNNTARPVTISGPLTGTSSWTGRSIAAWTEGGDTDTITINLNGMAANSLVFITPVTRPVGSRYFVTSAANSFTLSSTGTGVSTETMQFNWMVIRQQ